jgi:ribose 1,5-bisphosphokinase PhnN
METSTIIGIVIALVVVYLVYTESKKKGKPTKQSGVLRAKPKKKGRKSHSKTDLKKLTKNQLVELANKKNLKVKVSGKKADVINEIHEQLDDESDSDENADL